MKTILPDTAAKTLEEKRAALIDVREPGEFATVRVPGSTNVPLSSFEDGIASLPPGDLMILCARSPRAFAAAELLAKRGRDSAVVEGGIAEWIRRGLPAETGTRRVWPMERQVRFVAGVLVLAGVSLGFWVNAGFFGIAAFVGLGLTVSGLTGFCGMTHVLALCPWNRN